MAIASTIFPDFDPTSREQFPDAFTRICEVCQKQIDFRRVQYCEQKGWPVRKCKDCSDRAKAQRLAAISPPSDIPRFESEDHEE